MPDEAQGSDRGSVRQIAWHERLPWLCILRSFRLAIDPRQLALAAMGILLTAGGWWLLAFTFSGADDPTTKQVVGSYRVWPWSPAEPFQARGSGVKLAVRADDNVIHAATPPWYAASVPGPNDYQRWPHTNPIPGSWYVLSRPFMQLFDRGLDVTAFAFVLLCAVWATMVWALFGGAISRLAAMRLTRDERVPLGHGMRHARQRWGGYFWAPIFPLVGALLPTLGLVAVGWLLRFDFGLVILGILFPLMLIGGLLIAILLLGLFFGWPLMWATISVEGTDTFDALSRTYAYVYQRPLSYLFYVVVATLFGWLGGILAYAFGAGVVYLTLWGASWSAGPVRTDLVVADVAERVALAGPWTIGPPSVPPATATSPAGTSPAPSVETDERAAKPLSSTGRFGARLIAIWIGGVELLVVAFNFSFFWSAATAVYLLMRKQVDATEMDEVYVQEEEDRFGLPPLETDAAGVPQAADVETDTPPESNGGAQ